MLEKFADLLVWKLDLWLKRADMQLLNYLVAKLERY